MADKSVITNIEARVRQLIDDHKRLSDLCAELTAQRDTLRSEKRTLEERVRELDAELARMQLTEGLAGGGRNREKARARVNRLMREVDCRITDQGVLPRLFFLPQVAVWKPDKIFPY